MAGWWEKDPIVGQPKPAEASGNWWENDPVVGEPAKAAPRVAPGRVPERKVTTPAPLKPSDSAPELKPPTQASAAGDSGLWNYGALAGGLIKDFWHTLGMAGQGTDPELKDKDGNWLRPMLGTVRERDDGTAWVTTADGQDMQLSSDKHIVAWDDESQSVVAFERTQPTEELAITSAGRIALPGLVANPVVATRTPMQATGLFRQGPPPINRFKAVRDFTEAQRVRDAAHAARVSDAQAFREIGAPAFAPALADKGIARAGRTLEEMPSVIGEPIRTAKRLTEEAMAAKQGEIVSDLRGAGNAQIAGERLQAPAARTLEEQQWLARQMDAPGSADEMGGTLQRGLERQQQRITDMPPSQLREMNVRPVADTPRVDPRSVPARARAATAAPIRAAAPGGGVVETHRGADIPMARSRTEYLGQTRSGQIVQRRQASDMNDDELARLANAPASQVPARARSEALYEQAWRRVVPTLRRDGTANPQRVPSTNTRLALRGIEQDIANQIAGQSRLGGALAQRIMNPQAHFNLRDLRRIRTEIGRAMSDLNPWQRTLSGRQIENLYGALSRDIELGLQDLANRLWERTRLPGNRPDRALVEEARSVDQALYNMRRADRDFRAQMARQERFVKLAGAENPAQAARNLSSMLRSPTSNEQAVSAVRSVLMAPEWQQVSGFIVRQLGDGQAARVLADWEQLSDAARQAIRGAIPQHLQPRFDQLLRQSQLLSRAQIAGGEAGARGLQTALRAKTANHDKFRATMEALSSDEREEMAGWIIGELGRPNPGAEAAEAAAFNVSKFSTDWHALGKEGQDLLLSYLPEPVGRKLRQLAQVSDRMKHYELQKNWSGTAYTSMGVPGALSALFAGVLNPWTFAASLGAVAGAGGLSRLLTSERYLDWSLKTSQMSRTGAMTTAQRGTALNNLRALLLADPALAPMASAIAAEQGIGEGAVNDGPVQDQKPNQLRVEQ